MVYSGGFRINFGRMGFSNVNRMHSTRERFALRRDRNAATAAVVYALGTLRVVKRKDGMMHNPFVYIELDETF